MISENLTTDTPLFRFKNSRVSLNELLLLEFDAARLRLELAQHAARLPSLFRQMPVILNLEQLPADVPLPPLAELLTICRESALNPIGVKGNSRYDTELCRNLGLADFGQGRGETARNESGDAGNVTAPESRQTDETRESVASGDTQPADTTPGNSPTRILTTPVRSGQ